MHLNQLLTVLGLTGLESAVITGLSLDSRLVEVGDCFLAFPGLQVDGRDYIEQAAQAGAAAVLYEATGTPDFSIHIPAIGVENLAEKIGLLASTFYQQPGAAMHIVGITGTNGKTSVSHALAQCYALLGKKSAVMGTLGVGFLEQLQKTGMTTPDAVVVQQQLAVLRDQATDYVAMEVSSHALAQHRVVGVPFQTAVYTQLSPDHLDFHRDMDDYAACKEKLFQFKSLKNAVINVDDAHGRDWITRYGDKLATVAYTLQTAKSEVPTVCCSSFSTLDNNAGYQLQLSTPWGSGECELHLLGEYNIANTLAVVATLGVQGFSWEQIQSVVPQIKPVPGRLQWFRHPSGAVMVVDFAHTPDALKQVLKTLKTLCRGKLHCVFGCGGDRDSSKRTMMGEIAAALADHLVITNDNPRSEDPEQIADVIRAGCGDHPQVQVELDRQRAIECALTAADGHDMILVAGKGHETEQIVGDQVIAFSDIDCVQALCA